jgi:hypothetical protein
MKVKSNVLLFVVLFTAGCGTTRDLTLHKKRAETAESDGNYGRAMDAWQTYINEKKEAEEEVEGAVYARAAKTAFKAGKDDLAVNWFDQARYSEYADEKMYSVLAEIFHEKDNLSKELNALEYLFEHFGKENADVNERLFDIYHEIDMVEKALRVWDYLPGEAKGEEQNLEKYFEINKSLENEAICDSVSRELLERNPEHLEALEWNAKRNFWMAENRYQREMEKYNNNKTTRQYRILLKELDKSTADFKKARQYFEKLWELNSGKRKQYASYLATIFARFSDEQKASYYKKFLD